MKSTITFLVLAFVIATVTSEPTPTTPSPAHKSYVFLTVHEGGVYCILLNMTADFSFHYKDDSNKTQTYQMPLPTNATATGKCNTTQMMVIEFGKNSDKLTLLFGKDSANTYIENVTFAFTMDTTFPGITKPRMLQAESPGPFFKGSTGSRYVCKSNKTMALKGEVDVTLSTINMQVEAFRKSNNTEFSENAVNCPEDSLTSNIVPIAVGAALAALVVIVLIAYLISRNRNQRGYESV